MPIAKRIAAYQEKGSWIRKLFEEGAQMAADGSGRPVYDFSIGNPDLEPPAEFNAALREILDDPTAGTHKYMANVGYLETRKAVSDSLAADYDLPFTPEGVIMTVGAGGAINVAFKALLDPGEEVIAVAPYFVEYRFYTENHGGRLVEAKSAPDFTLDVDDIEARITDQTRIVVITNPNNPSGVLYPQENLDALGAMLRRKSEGRERPIFLIDDAPYRKLVFDVDRCTSAFAAYENTLMGTSHSKDLGLPGERIGFLAISPRMEGWQKVAGAAAFTNRTLGFVNAPALMQRVVARLQGQSGDLAAYARKRQLLCDGLKAAGYDFVAPGGAFYLFPKTPVPDDVEFVRALQDELILAVPGAGFGGPGHFRISFCVSDETITGAMPGFKRAMDKFR